MSQFACDFIGITYNGSFKVDEFIFCLRVASCDAFYLTKYYKTN